MTRATSAKSAVQASMGLGGREHGPVAKGSKLPHISVIHEYQTRNPANPSSSPTTEASLSFQASNSLA